jgi:predicted nucleotidyltransferase component of viral defense system
MSPSLEYLERCSAETGHRVTPLEKVVRLGEIGADLARHPFLSEVLVLKGGTPFNLCFGQPQRLSVDLDYNYVGHVERERMLEDRPRVEEAVAEVARRRGYAVQQSADAFAGRKLYLRYQSVLGQPERIEVDLNYLFRVPIAGIETRTLWQPGDLDRPQIRVVGLAELVAGKMLALLDRGAVRDAWDVAHLPEPAIEMLATPLFRARFIALSAVLARTPASHTRDRLRSHVTDHDVAEQLIPMLATSEDVNAEDLVERAWAIVKPFLALDPHEEAYLAAILDGELRPELLFPSDAAEAARFARHPALQWKVTNVKAMRSRRDSR